MPSSSILLWEFNVLHSSVSNNSGLGGYCTTCALQKSTGFNVFDLSKKNSQKNNSYNYKVNIKWFLDQFIVCIYVWRLIEVVIEILINSQHAIVD